MRWLRYLVIRLDIGPFHRIFTAIYAFGLNILLARLVKHPAIHSIYGTGSFFNGTHLAGHSDIDLQIILTPAIKRTDGTHVDLARIYNRYRLVFPFLGGWDEKESTLIYLDEVARGMPILESFRVRLKCQRLVRLHGPPFPNHLEQEPLSSSEIISEMNTLLRTAVSKSRRHSVRKLFWKRLWSKLEILADYLGEKETVLRHRDESLPDLTRRSDRELATQACQPEQIFPHFEAAMLEILLNLGRTQKDPITRFLQGPAKRLLNQNLRSVPARALSLIFAAGASVKSVSAVSAIPLGMLPRHYYFSIDCPMVVVSLEKDGFEGIKRLAKCYLKEGQLGDSILVWTGCFYYVVTKQSEFIDILPLDPLTYASVYAFLSGQDSYSVPISIFQEQTREAHQWFQYICMDYHANTAWVAKLSHRCLYREDDRDTICEALNTLRTYFWTHADHVLILTMDQMEVYLTERYRPCIHFISALFEEYAYLIGRHDERSSANNLYRCLHQFMFHVLSGELDFTIDPITQQLSLTVGIITRNRANDLREALTSITTQTRVPDEVIVVDNGSTDHTTEVIASFADTLPIRSFFLELASIPAARNQVLLHASHEIVAFADDDAACDPGWLASIERGFLRAENVGMVGGWVEHWPAYSDSAIDRYYEVFHSHKA